MENFSPDKRAKDGLQSCCKDCYAKQHLNWYYENKEKHIECGKRWEEKNRDKVAQIKRKHYLSNKTKCDARSAQWRNENPEKRIEICLTWAKNNPHKVSEIVMRRNARKLNQTPPDADFNKIQEFYIKRDVLNKLTGIKHEVDHIIPLSRGGLHHQDNLQILTKSQNCIKGNR